MSENLIIGWPRWTEDVTWSGGAWNASFPITNLATLPLSRVARTTNVNLASTQIIGTFSANRSVSVMALARHNISLTAQIRIRLYSDSARTQLVYNTDWVDVWPSIFLPDDLEWEDDNWWLGTPTSLDIEGSSPTRPFYFGSTLFIRAFHIEIDDQLNTDGYVQIGLCEVARGWQLSYNPVFGYQEGFRFRSEVLESIGGVKYFDRRDKPRVASGNIEYLPRDEAMARGFEWMRQADIDKPFIWFPFPDEIEHWTRTVFVARQVDPGLISYSQVDASSFPISVEEVL